MISFFWVFLVSVLLFAIGLWGFLRNKNPLIQLISVEILLASSGILVAGYSYLRYASKPEYGHYLILIIMAIAAAEAATGLTLIYNIHRIKKDSSHQE